jgi:uracil-DNA glycosylase
MRPCEFIGCELFPCGDVRHERFSVPGVDVDAARVRIVLISECTAPDPADDYYAPGDPLFARTTVAAFRDAGADVTSIADILDLGVYLTTAVKCAKTGYGIAPSTVKECSRLLGREVDLFPNVRAYLLMGDVAISALNSVATARGEKRVIPSGATYRIRGGAYTFHGARAFPSYLQAGPSFFIERRKREMIAEDIAAALRVAAGA